MASQRQRTAVVESVRGAMGDEFEHAPMGDLLELIFTDPRENGSMLLTALGYDLMLDNFDSWSQDLPHAMTFANHTYLVNVSKFPYYVKSKVERANPHGFPIKTSCRITTFDSNLGVLIKMVSGDFGQLERLLPRN